MWHHLRFRILGALVLSVPLAACDDDTLPAVVDAAAPDFGPLPMINDASVIPTGDGGRTLAGFQPRSMMTSAAGATLQDRCVQRHASARELP